MFDTASLRNVETEAKAARIRAMFVAGDAGDLFPGPLGRTEGESDERYAKSSALMGTLFAMSAPREVRVIAEGTFIAGPFPTAEKPRSSRLLHLCDRLDCDVMRAGTEDA